MVSVYHGREKGHRARSETLGFKWRSATISACARHRTFAALVFDLTCSVSPVTFVVMVVVVDGVVIVVPVIVIDDSLVDLCSRASPVLGETILIYLSHGDTIMWFKGTVKQITDTTMPSACYSLMTARPAHIPWKGSPRWTFKCTSVTAMWRHCLWSDVSYTGYQGSVGY